ncbi:transcription factor [Tieghemostelium lacteum]|uniref:Transcription factor n=1 Tax=Tieghemostelium lacteum TaxID=361077 RepID=A0A151Z7P6_TIELA|nr:transcription factor [Tieghemostelium lacteum]|eukprot:KYQ89955.1 transcription factor [Tieghemostelium lacteum]
MMIRFGSDLKILENLLQLKYPGGVSGNNQSNNNDTNNSSNGTHGNTIAIDMSDNTIDTNCTSMKFSTITLSMDSNHSNSSSFESSVGKYSIENSSFKLIATQNEVTKSQQDRGLVNTHNNNNNNNNSNNTPSSAHSSLDDNLFKVPSSPVDSLSSLSSSLSTSNSSSSLISTSSHSPISSPILLSEKLILSPPSPLIQSNPTTPRSSSSSTASNNSNSKKRKMKSNGNSSNHNSNSSSSSQPTIPEGYKCKCGATTPGQGPTCKWRRGIDNEILCNSCGLQQIKNPTCIVCSKVFNKKDTSPNNLWIRCDDCKRWVMSICDKSITDISQYDNINPDNKAYACPHCKEKTIQIYSFDNNTYSTISTFVNDNNNNNNNSNSNNNNNTNTSKKFTRNIKGPKKNLSLLQNSNKSSKVKENNNNSNSYSTSKSNKKKVKIDNDSLSSSSTTPSSTPISNSLETQDFKEKLNSLSDLMKSQIDKTNIQLLNEIENYKNMLIQEREKRLKDSIELYKESKRVLKQNILEAKKVIENELK